MAQTDGATPETRPGLHVLVVDDDQDTADTLVILLEMWGHRPRAAYDAADALRAAAAAPPDAVLVDLELPGHDGFALATALRARDGMRDLKLYAVTGHSVYRDQALAGPFDDFLLKPVEPGALCSLLAELQQVRHHRPS